MAGRSPFFLKLTPGICRAFFWCAEHAQQLGGASPLSSLMVVKD